MKNIFFILIVIKVLTVYFIFNIGPYLLIGPFYSSILPQLMIKQHNHYDPTRHTIALWRHTILSPPVVHPLLPHIFILFPASVLQMQLPHFHYSPVLPSPNCPDRLLQPSLSQIFQILSFHSYISTTHHVGRTRK